MKSTDPFALKAIALLRQALAIGPVDASRELEGLARMAALLIATGRSQQGVRLVAAIEANYERLNYSPAFGGLPSPFVEALEIATREPGGIRCEHGLIPDRTLDRTDR